MKKLTYKEWLELGKKSKELRSLIHELLPLMSGKMAQSKYNLHYQALKEAFEKFRSDLDDEMFKQLPKSEGASPSIFYGHDE